jgi:NADP-dependent 3-hydroxy acid dehydrogenase YdfG
MTNENKIVLITGASSGFGALTTEKLAQQGYTVYGTSRRELPHTESGVRMRVLDVTDPDSVQACINGILDEVGRIDLLVNSAGIGQ